MFQQLLQRVLNILLKPVEEWKRIKGETWTLQSLFLRYALILGAIPVVAGFIGLSLVGVSFFGHTFRYPIGNCFLWMVMQYVFNMGVVVGAALVMDALAPTFGAKKDLLASLKVVVFSFTASWVAGIFNLIPTLSVLGMLAGIYSLVLMYFGMQALRNVPQDKLVGYYVACLVTTLVMFIVAGMLVQAIALPSATSAPAESTRALLESLR